MYNHTPGGSKSLRLSGRAANEIVGLGKVLKVVPGDVVDMEVYATYYSPETTSSMLAGSFLGALSGLFGPGAGLGIDGSGFSQSLNDMLSGGQLLKAGDDNDDTPRAYINYILFDENFILQDFDFKRITEAGHKTGTAAAHDKLELSTLVSKPGYLYIYLSNENDKIVDVYFDDLKITHHHSPIVQAADYYPFGMTFNSYSRENSTPNKYLYQGKEYQNELGLDTYDIHARMYDPAIARTFQLDPHAENYYSYSSYSWAGNNPLKFIDPDGKDIINISGGVRFTGLDAQIAFKAIQQNNYKGIHLVEEKNTPSIYKHTLNAFREGKPEVLHYDSDKNRQKQRRDEALANHPSRGDGTSRDEYPYASTFEGGKGALVTFVPARENSIQGGKLSALYRTLDQGDAFLVLPVPKER